MGMRTQTVENAKNQAHLFTDRGTVEFHLWGDETWHEAYHNAVIREGDTIRTGPNSFAVLEFFDGSRVRINENTEFTLERLDSSRRSIEVDLRIQTGELWVNELNTEYNLLFHVYTPHIYATSIGTVYSVEVSEEEIVRVVRGEVRARIQDTLIEDAELLEAVNIGIGQQISVGNQDISDLEARKFVNLLESVDDYWRVTEWHLWNVSEDGNPTQYVTDQEKLAIEESIDSEVADEEVVVELPKVSVTYPAASPFDLNEDQIYLKGEVSHDVTQVVITEFSKDPKGVPYELSKFVPGSGIWNYSAGLEFGNLVIGKNRFVVQAFNGDGLVSDPVEIVINVAERSEVEPSDDVVEIVEEEVPVVFEPEPTEEVSLEPIEDAVVELTVPRITSVDNAEEVGENRFRTTAKRVVVNGLVSPLTEKVIVNGWALTLYEPGSKYWQYFAKESIGTLKRGENVYNVYAVDADGKRTNSMTFYLIKE